MVSVIVTLLAVAVLACSISAAELSSYRLGGWGFPLGIHLVADRLGLLFMLMTAVVALGVGVYATQYFGDHAYFPARLVKADAVDKQSDTPSSSYNQRDDHHTRRKSNEGDRVAAYWTVWNILWAGLNALYLSSDIFNIYVALELIGISAVALVNLKPSEESLNSSLRYLLVSLLGSMFYLIGVVIIYGEYGNMDLAYLHGQIQNSWPTTIATICMVTGIAFKAAVFPFHFWLPPAHASATAPVSALLSALVVKSDILFAA